MTQFTAFMRGEDHTEFTIVENAPDLDAALEQIEESYPEAQVLQVFDENERKQQGYERAVRWMDGDTGHFDCYDQ
jgi:hypothetical protein